MRPGSPATATVAPGRGLAATGLRAIQSPLPPADVATLGRVPVTSEPRTAADLLARLDWDEARSLFAWLVTRRRFGYPDLLASIDRRPRLRGTAQLRRLARVSESGSLSVAEDRMHGILRAGGLTGWQANVPVRVGGRVVAVVDVLFAAERVALEVDGYASHSGREVFQRDRRRRMRLSPG